MLLELQVVGAALPSTFGQQPRGVTSGETPVRQDFKADWRKESWRTLKTQQRALAKSHDSQPHDRKSPTHVEMNATVFNKARREDFYGRASWAWALAGSELTSHKKSQNDQKWMISKNHVNQTIKTIQHNQNNKTPTATKQAVHQETVINGRNQIQWVVSEKTTKFSCHRPSPMQVSLLLTGLLGPRLILCAILDTPNEKRWK